MAKVPYYWLKIRYLVPKRRKGWKDCALAGHRLFANCNSGNENETGKTGLTGWILDYLTTVYIDLINRSSLLKRARARARLVTWKRYVVVR